jgi:uncharacterized ion transporter superfamily protein YfcC
MIPKSSWLYAIGLLKCPRCHRGDMYLTPTFSFKKSFDMHDKCPYCDQRFTLETGFYYGAMFISYILTAFMMFGIFAIFKFGFNWEVTTAFFAAMGIIMTLFVWFFRVSRTIWLSFFVKYEKNNNG